MSAGDLAQALKCYQEILIEYPGDTVALTMSARLTTSATGDASAQPSTS
jgi:hypothetical protein